MNLQNILHELAQADGEITDRLTHVSRRAMFSNLSKKTIAVAAPTIMASALTSAYGQASGLPQNVVDILNFALTLEYLEAEFYQRGTDTPGLIPGQFQTVFRTLRQHEEAHVRLLRSVLGSQAVAKPMFDFTAKGLVPTVFTNFQSFAALSQGFEDLGVRAYKGQATGLMNAKPILDVALQIHAVEAAHAAKVRTLRGQKGWVVLSGPQGLPAAFEPIYSKEVEFIQGGVNTLAATEATVGKQMGTKIGVEAATEAWDEPLSREEVLALARPFLA